MTDGKWIETRYPISNGLYSHGQIFVRDGETEEDAVERRGLKEEPTRGTFFNPPVMPSEWLRRGEKIEALHAAIWLGGIACRIGVYSGESLLEDDGVIHEMAHIAMTHVSEGDILLMIERLEQFEANIPGLS